jgi:hypothetical protein
LADVLCMAYTLRLQELADEVHAHTVGAAVAQALGAQPAGGDPLDWDAARAQFDERLSAPPADQAPDAGSPRQIKMRALGMAR